MTNDMNLHHGISAEERETNADEYGAAQRRAYLDGFERAMDEAENMAALMDWLQTERDEARALAEEREDSDMFYARYRTYVDVITRLIEMGVAPGDGGDQS